MQTRVPKQYKMQATQLELRAEGDLPPGVVGRVTGIALVYGETDAYGTQFARGSLDRTRAERMSSGKIKLFADHMAITSQHVGVVRSLDDVGDAAVMTADLFDTAEGRKMKEYLAAVMAAGAETGLSIGFVPRKGMPNPDDPSVYVFTEIELREISITPVPAVPGAEVAGVRNEEVIDEDFLPEQALRVILAALSEEEARRVFDEVFPRTQAVGDDTAPTMLEGPNASREDTADTAEVGERAKAATMDERIAALRASFRL